MNGEGNWIEGFDPIDRLAALQMAKGIKLSEPELKPSTHIKRWSHCPPLKKHIGNTPDLTGRIVGRLTVVGPLRGVYGQDGSKWVVSCACRSGEYFETRTSKAINNKKNKDDCCRTCRSMRRKIESYHYFRSIGK